MVTMRWSGPFWSADVRRWQACREQARADMLAEGWIERSAKFDQVCFRRAKKLFFARHR